MKISEVVFAAISTMVIIFELLVMLTLFFSWAFGLPIVFKLP